jgi:hypothetical protein
MSNNTTSEIDQRRFRATALAINALKLTSPWSNLTRIARELGVTSVSVSRWLVGVCLPEPDRVIQLAKLVSVGVPGINENRLWTPRIQDWLDGISDQELELHMESIPRATNQLLALRLAANVRVAEAAELLNISRQYLYRLEKLQPRDHQLTIFVKRAEKAYKTH